MSPYMVHIMVRVKKEISRGVFRVLPQRWTVTSGMQCGRTWKFTPEQLQDPVNMVKYIMEKCCGSFREVRSYATCWSLLLIEHCSILESTLMGRKAKEEALWPLNCSWTREQPVPVAVAPTNEDINTKSVRLVGVEEEVGPSWVKTWPDHRSYGEARWIKSNCRTESRTDRWL